MAFSGVMYYNYQKIQAMKQQTAAADKKTPEKALSEGFKTSDGGGGAKGEGEREPLISPGRK